MLPQRFKKYIPVCIILLLTLVLRFTYLDRIPNAIGGDELTYILTAKSIALTGKDITGTWNPLSAFMFRYPPNEMQAELPYFIHLPFSGFFPFSLFIARLPFALLSVGIVLLLYFLTKRLVGTKEAFFVGLVASANPWLIYIGRTAYETTPATFFYLLGFYLLLILKKQNILWSIPVFFLAFYSYIGLKLIFLPLILLFTVFAWYQNKKDSQWYRIVVVTGVLLTIFYAITIFTASKGSRVSDLFLPNMNVLSQEVDSIRKTTMQNPLTELYINKYTVFSNLLITKFLKLFSPIYLFLKGDQFFSIQSHGFFYSVDFLFTLLGLVYIFYKKRIVFVFLIATIFLSTLPHVFHSTQEDFSPHIAFMFPFFILCIGCGITWFLSIFPKNIRKFASIATGVVYIFFVGNFLVIYFFQHPLMGYFDFSMRTLSRYISLTEQNHQPVTLYTNAHRDFFKKYLFYTNSLTKNNIADIYNLTKNDVFTFNSVTFSSCNTFDVNENPSHIQIIDTNCADIPEGPHLRISNLSDGGGKYLIYNDVLCYSYQLKSYPSNLMLANFTIEKLNTKEFCETFINL